VCVCVCVCEQGAGAASTIRLPAHVALHPFGGVESDEFTTIGLSYNSLRRLNTISGDFVYSCHYYLLFTYFELVVLKLTMILFFQVAMCKLNYLVNKRVCQK
jgi:hypothetical protein